MRRPRDLLLLGLLAALPLLAHAPAWLEGRLLGPGDGAALHYPLRAEVWAAVRRGELPSWNPGSFSGTPLLAAYRPGALYPPMLLLAALPDFVAFQALVLGSLAASGVLVFLYVRRLGAGPLGAFVSGLCFCLGPYLVGHLGDTATVVAAPLLPLVLLAAESHVNRATPGRTLGLAGATALLLLAGSPEAARAGLALIAGRLIVGHAMRRSGNLPSFRSSLLALACGAAFAAPQLLPTLLALPEAGRQATGLAPALDPPLPGATGLVLRYVSHTPAAALALAALPLATTEIAVRVLSLALGLCLALQWERGPLSAPGALALVFDLALAVLAGIALSVQWRARLRPRGRRLRALFLLVALASAAALSVAAAALGPLPDTLAGAVGVLALSLILYFTLADDPDPVRARVFLLPLTVSFLLQPHGRGVWRGAPTREELRQGTTTRQAIESRLGPRVGERSLTLARRWPPEAADLAFPNPPPGSGRRSANGYDPMVPLRVRVAYGGMGAAGILPASFFKSDPLRLELLGTRFVQVPVSELVAAPDRNGLGEPLDLEVERGRPRFFPLPIVPATEVRLGSHLAEAVDVPQDAAVALVEVRLATGRSLPLWLRAGRDTAEWAIERPAVRVRVAHARAPVLDSWQERGGYEAHRYLGTLPLPGRYFVDGVRIERLPGPGRLTLARLGVADGTSGRVTAASLVAGYVSDGGVFRERAATPGVRLFELPGSPGHARVVERLRGLPHEAALLRVLGSPARSGVDPRREALTLDAAPALPAAARSSHAEVARAVGNRIEVRAEGPGLLVVAESWDPGWSAQVDGAPAGVLRVNQAQLGILLGPGTHRVFLRHRPGGFAAGVALALLAAAAGAMAVARARGRERV